MTTQYNESEWGWFIDLEHNEVTMYKPLIKSSLPTIHEYSVQMPKFIGNHVDLDLDLSNETKGSIETNAYTIYKQSLPLPIIHEYQLQIFMNGHVIREISIPWTKVEQVVLNLKIPWSEAGNFGALFMVFMLYSLYKYHAL